MRVPVVSSSGSIFQCVLHKSPQSSEGGHSVLDGLKPTPTKPATYLSVKLFFFTPAIHNTHLRYSGCWRGRHRVRSCVSMLCRADCLCVCLNPTPYTDLTEESSALLIPQTSKVQMTQHVSIELEWVVDQRMDISEGGLEMYSLRSMQG